MARKLTKYKKVIRYYLTEYAQKRNRKEVSYHVLFDEKRFHDQLARMSWEKETFYSTLIFHFEIKEGAQVWIWVNHTKLPIDEVLTECGIAKQDVCLGIYSAALQQEMAA